MAQPNLKFKITAVDVTQKAFSTVKRSLQTVSKALFSFKTALAAAAGITGLGLLVKSSLDGIDRISKLSRTLGISVQDLRKLELAADLSGVQIETLARGVRTLNKGMIDFVRDGTGEAMDAFEALGISADDLNGVMGDQFKVLELIADRFKNVQNSAERSAIAQQLFGGRASELLLVLEEGSEGLRRISKEAADFGLILSASTAKNVEEANDAFTRLGSLFKGLTDTVTGALAPAFQFVADTIRDKLLAAVKDAGGVEEFGLRLARNIIVGARDASRAMINLVNGIIKQLNNLGFAFEKMREFFGFGVSETEFAKSFDILITKFEKFNQMTGSAEFRGGMENVQMSLNKLADPANRTKENIEQVIRELKQFAETNISVNAAVQSILPNLEGLSTQSEDVRESFDGIGKVTLNVDDTFNKLLASLDRVNRDIGGTGGLSESANTAAISTKILYDEFGDLSNAVGNLSPKLQLTKTSLEQYEDAAHQVGKSLDQLAVDSLRKLEDSFAGMVTGTMSAKDAFRSMANSILSDLARIAARKALGSIMGGFGGGDLFGSLFGGFRANGGAVTAGKAYVVGERGAEMFVPSQNGTIIPNGAMGGAGVTVNQTINLSTGVAQTVRTEVMNMLPQIQNAAVSGVLDAKRRGGSFSSAFGV
jgi:methyl-accepting chemotaxis protein